LANLRKAAGFSQQELADTLGTRQSTIASWERSANPPRGEFLPMLAKTLGVSADVLLQMERRQKHPGPASRIEQLFQEVSSLPRRRQERIVTVVQALLSEEVQAS
jgi:transcriptional regulator with XRE-family HTH domain